MEILPVHAKINADVKADATPVIQAVADAVHSPQKGIGKILNALVGPWVASRERVEALLRAQTERDCKRITDGSLTYRDGNLLPMPDSSADIYTALHSLNHQADAKRLEAAVLEAVRQLSDVPPEQISDEPLSQTFFNRWRREAEMIDEEELRQWWARILVEETKKPNSISPRTLEVARSLTREEALLFQKLCRGVIGSALIISDEGHPINGTYAEILQLQDVGLINGQSSMQTQKALQKNKFGAEYVAEYFLPLQLMIYCETKELNFQCNILTHAGMEIMKTIPITRTGDDVVAIAKLMAGHCKPSKVSVLRLFTSSVDEHGSTRYQVHDMPPIWSNTTTQPTKEPQLGENNSQRKD